MEGGRKGRFDRLECAAKGTTETRTGTKKTKRKGENRKTRIKEI